MAGNQYCSNTHKFLINKLSNKELPEIQGMMEKVSNTTIITTKATTTIFGTVKKIALYVLPILVAFAAHVVIQLRSVGHPLSFIYPNFLLFYTGNNYFLSQHWPKIATQSKEKILPEPIPEISAEEYTQAALKELSFDLTRPVVIRGLFENANAIKKWPQDGYLSSKLGDYLVRSINLGPFPSPQDNRTVMPISQAVDEIFYNKDSMRYLFFPMIGKQYDSPDIEPPALTKVTNQLLLDDLEIDKKIYPGYGSKTDRKFLGQNVLVGRGKKNVKETTGTPWHNAIGFNYFIQVVGRKRWYFLDPQYGPYLHMVRGGAGNFMAGSMEPDVLQEYLPTKFVDLEPGDCLFNPPWQWHSVVNHEGLNMGVATRHAHLSGSWKNSNLFTAITLWNKVREKLFGMNVGEVSKAHPQKG